MSFEQSAKDFQQELDVVEANATCTISFEKSPVLQPVSDQARQNQQELCSPRSKTESAAKVNQYVSTPVGVVKRVQDLREHCIKKRVV